MVFATLLTLLCNLFAAAGDGPAGTYNCSKLTAEEACKATGWCVWTTLGGARCVYDECLKWVSDDDQAPCAASSYPDPTGIVAWTCTLYYLTDAHDCTSGNPIQTDRYCRSNVVANNRNPMEECFYYDLKALAQATPSNYCPGPECAQTSNSDGKYCAPTGNPACNEFYGAGNYEQFCNCLGLGEKSYCDLFPGCQNTSSGCIVDPCYRYTAPDFGGCIGTGIPSNLASTCGNQTVNKPNAAYDGAVTGKICVTSSRNYNTINSCFYLQETTSENPYPEYPECSTLKENEPVCTNSPVLSSGGGPDGNKTCSFTPIAGKYFEGPDGHYCDDNIRKNGVPSPSAATLVHVPLFIAVILAGLALLA